MKEATDRVSNLVVVKKPNGDLSICIDLSDLNKANNRSHHPLPTFEQIILKLRNAKIFSLNITVESSIWLFNSHNCSENYTKTITKKNRIDAKDGFWQVKLTKKLIF